MPLKFWDEAFLTSVFLINRLPSRVIHGENPLECLTGKKTDYTFYALLAALAGPMFAPITLANSNLGLGGVFF
jgi:hypothetical protein